MNQLDLNMTDVPFSQLAAMDGDGFLAKLAGRELADYPLFDPERIGEASGSRWLDRARLAKVLSAFNESVGNPLDASTLAAIEGDGVMVVGGQQPGLLMGPNYTFLKAISLIALARKLSEQSGRTVLPVFWIATEDHDVAEVNHVHVNGRRFSCDHDFLNAGGAWPQVGDVSLEGYRDDLLAFVDEALIETEFKAELIALIEQGGFTDYGTSFARQMAGLFAGQGLVLVDAIGLRPLTGAVLAEAVRCWPEVEQAFREQSDRVRAAGVASPVERVGLFEIIDGRRVAVEIDHDGATVGGERRHLSEAADYIAAHVEDFSGNAALRPILQDAVLPNLATIGGPGELKYLWQLDGIADALEVRRAAMWPRVFATFVTGTTLKKAHRVGLEGEAIFDVMQKLAEHDTDVASITSPEADAIERIGGRLLEAIGQVESKANPTLAAKAAESVEHQVNRLVEALREEKLAEQGRSRRDLERIAEELFPKGKPQERIASTYDLLNRYGLALVPALIEAVDPFAMTHRLIEVRHRSS